VSGLIGHLGILRELRALAESADPPHALLFAGPEGTGRGLLALEYAKLLNCERAVPPAGASLFGDALPPAATGIPCNECRPCRHINEGTHPDIITLAPGDTLCRPRAGETSHERHPLSRDIRICQVRGVIDLVSRYPFEARTRMILIDPAERFGRDAAHTILKTLEEPPGHTVFALISAAPEAIIETILSRCRRIEVHTVARAEIEAGLVERGVAPALAAEAAAASRGRPGRALAFANEPDLMGVRKRLLERCERMATATSAERFRYSEEMAERWRRDRATVLNEIDAWEAFWEDRLRAAARVPGEGPAAAVARTDVIGATDALRAVQRARDDLQAQVMARAAIDLMLLSFPRSTLVGPAQEDTASHA